MVQHFGISLSGDVRLQDPEDIKEVCHEQDDQAQIHPFLKKIRVNYLFRCRL